MKRQKYRDYLWFVATAVFVICVIEGIFYYHDVENPFLKVSLNIQNAIKAYKIDPDIKQKQAIEYMNECGGGLLCLIITYVYCVAVIVAPFCTIGALTILIRKPANYVKGLVGNWKQPKVLVIGDGQYLDNFIGTLTKKCNVDIIDKEDISEDKKLYYLNQGVKIYRRYSDMDVDMVLKGLKISKYEMIILCCDNTIENIEYLREFEKNASMLNSADPKKDITVQKVYLCCTDSSMSELIKREYDSDKLFELSIIDINKMAVNKMFSEHKIYAVNDKDYLDVHIGIIGFGEFGQSTLIQAMNLSVLSPDSNIIFDVYDNNMDSIIGSFMKNFSVDVLNALKKKSKDIYHGKIIDYYELKFPIDNFEIEGSLCIRFWNVDVNTLYFNRLFDDNNGKENGEIPFTYLVLAMGDTHTMAKAIIDIKQILHDYKTSSSNKHIPIIIRTKGDDNFIEIYKDDELFSIERDKDIFSYDSITDKETIDMAKRFNYLYNEIYNISKGYEGGTECNREFINKYYEFVSHEWNNISKEKLHISENISKMNRDWLKMKMFKRESSIGQSLHQDVKKWLVCEKKIYSLDDEEDREKLGQIEHRRWNIYMISHGYKYAPEDKLISGKDKDLFVKTHPCILTWENLKTDEMQWKKVVCDFIPYFILNNDV